MKLEENLVQNGLEINRKTVIKLVYAADLPFMERIKEVAHLFIPTILDSTSVMNFEGDSVDISESSGILGGILYLVSILRGTGYVIKVYKK